MNLSLEKPEELESPDDLRGALNRANQQLINLASQSMALAEISLRQTCQLTLLCEAYLAGDGAKVTDLVHAIATHYSNQAKLGAVAPRKVH